MADKVKLFVNGQEVEVESGKNLIDAIGAVGIEIPHLCYHPALGADGNCRMCLVGIEAGFGPQGAPALWLHEHAPPPGTVGVGTHLAFVAPTREAVDRFHAAGLAAGARDNGKPGLRRDYGETYYAAFLVDGEGNNVEAVCMKG